MYKKHANNKDCGVDEQEGDYAETSLSVSVLSSFPMNVPVKRSEKIRFYSAKIIVVNLVLRLSTHILKYI